MKVVLKGVMDKKAIISSDNALAPNRWQAIIGTNNGLENWYIYASLRLNELALYTLYNMLKGYIDGLVQDCSNSNMLALELL